MSRHSAKSAGRSAKAAGGARKKTSKAARSTATKAKSGRRPVGKATRTAPKPVAKAARKPAAKAVAKSAELTATIATFSEAAAAMMIRTYSPPVQPVAPEVPVGGHRYQVGQTVYYTSPSFGRAAASGSYTVVKLLPSDGDDFQYRIKSSDEAFERVAKESQLDKA